MQTPKRIVADATVFFRGMLMGGADVIPGVSGGTVALIVGIYERLITSISHVDRRLIGHLRGKQWRAAADHLDLRFLAALGCGILTGVVVVGSIVQQLLTNDVTRPLTLASFFGMILASAVIVAKMIQPRSRQHATGLWMLGILGAGVAGALTMLGGSAAAEPSTLFVFVCGVIAICAMILPGISGAYLLLILGLYPHLTGILERLREGAITASDVGTVAVFGCGCVVGITSFSKGLRWLLAHQRAPTLSVLCGFMIGALGKIWPFQLDLTPEVAKLKHKQFEMVWPSSFDGQTITCLTLGIIAFLCVWVAHRMVHPKETQHSRKPSPLRSRVAVRA